MKKRNPLKLITGRARLHIERSQNLNSGCPLPTVSLLWVKLCPPPTSPNSYVKILTPST